MAAFSNTRPPRNGQPRGEEIASFRTYAEAQRAVDYLSDQHFDVKAVTIVGTDLKMVERITGRLNYPRAALSGAASGAWFGLFVGLLLALITGGAIMNTLLFALLIGAGFGMMFGVIAYALTGGKRDFTSSSQVVASSFAVLCLPETAGQARRMLSELSGTAVTQAQSNPVTAGAQQDPTAAFQRPQQPPSQQQQHEPQQPVTPPPPEDLPAWARDPAAFQRPQEPGPQDTSAQDPSAQQPNAQQPSAQQPSAHQPGVQDPSAHQPGAQDPSAQQPEAQASGPEQTEEPTQDSQGR